MNVSIFASTLLVPHSWGITWDMDLDWHYTCRCESQVRSTELVEATSFMTSSRPVCSLPCGVITSSLRFPVAHRSWRMAKVKSSQGLVLLAKPFTDEGAGESHWGLSFPKGLINQWFYSLKYCEFLLQITLNVETMQCRRPGLILESGKSSVEGNGNALQYFCLENFMDREAWQATVHGVAKSLMWLSN